MVLYAIILIAEMIIKEKILMPRIKAKFSKKTDEPVEVSE